MPTYEYECTRCGYEFEVICPVKDYAVTLTCPSCEMNTAKLLISKGFTHGDQPSWINQDLRDSIQGDGEKPLETRKEYNDYLKEKNIAKI